MYKFYALIETEEHLLYVNEIAMMFGIYSTTGKAHGSLVKRAVLDYLEENNMTYQPYFYNSKYGMREVFSQDIYIPAINRLIKNSINNEYISNNKKYKFLRRDALCHI